MKTCAAILIATCAALAQAPPKSTKTTVCAVVASPQTYSGKVISISGRVESDGVHRTLVVDDRCVERGIGLIWHSRYQGEEALTSAFRRGFPGTIDKTITATLIGKFNWNPGEHPPHVLELREASDVSVVMNGAEHP